MTDIVKKCAKHGDLTISDVIKSNLNTKGGQTYRCKFCMKESHKKHYQKNKDRVLEAHRKYIEKNPTKAKQMKNASKRKMYASNPDKYLKKSKNYDLNNPDRKSARQKRYKDKAVVGLSDIYVKQHLVRGTVLKYADIPQSLVQVKKVLIKLKRGIKDAKAKNHKKELQKRIDKIDRCK